MSRILLADDSPHAQRMGERILREEGFEVVTVTDGDTALIRLSDVDPDVVMADVFLPQKSGYEICRHIKAHPKHRHARVVLLAGLLEPVDEAEAERVRADAILKKPFEASVVISTIRPLLEASKAAREALEEAAAAVEASAAEEPAPAPPDPEPDAAGEIDRERVRAAVTIALDRAMPAMIDEITARVLVALGK
jgi:CheY-like chemotaxis protein